MTASHQLSVRHIVRSGSTSALCGQYQPRYATTDPAAATCRRCYAKHYRRVAYAMRGEQVVGTNRTKVQNSCKLYSHAVAAVNAQTSHYEVVSWHTSERAAQQSAATWRKANSTACVVPVIVTSAPDSEV